MLEIEVKTLIENIYPNQVFLGLAPADTSAPYICCTCISSTYGDVMSGQIDSERCFQVDIYTEDYIDGVVIKEKVYQELTTLMIHQTTSTNVFDKDLVLYKESLKFFL